MSLLLGLVYFDQENADDSCMSKMLEPLKNMPHDKIKINKNKEAIFAKQLTYGTEEDVYDVLPLYLSEIDTLFVSQGRIDNREELIYSLALGKGDEISDSFIMLQAYLKYGDQVQLHLKGEWSLAAYQYESKKLFITRDVMGYTSLYYFQSKEFFAFSSSIKSILQLPKYSFQLNEFYFISYLSIWKFEEKLEEGLTFYKDVYYLPNGFSIFLSHQEKSLKKYWPPQNVHEIHYKNKQDYVNEIVEIFQVAVKRRLRSYKPVASMLSGGLDSSSVSYIAAELLKLEGKQLNTYSHVPHYTDWLQKHPLSSLRELNEHSNIQSIVDTSGNIKAHYLSAGDFSPIDGLEIGLDILDGPVHAACNIFWIIDLYKNCAKDGFGSILTGEGGNGSISYTGEDYLLKHSWERLLNQPYRYFKSQLVKPIVYKYLKKIWEKKDPSLKNYVQSQYINSTVLEDYDIINDLEKNGTSILKVFSSGYEAKQRLIQLYTPRSLMGAAFGQYYGIELRDPTCDIDLVNYFFRIPNEEFIDSHYQYRMLVKNMMANKLPDQVLFSNKKGLQNSDLTPRILDNESDLFKILDTIKKSSMANHYFDLKQLEGDLPIFHANFENGSTFEKQQKILKSVQFARFLKKFD
ncbi:asparagine synthetase B family protein [Aquirufa ecclesiirivi]|uniref:asparagine synthase-related protein n=1 Tax=Aquirufa ecclesiirivi TaxID=2715124 RepID=UPI0023D7CD76|nr:asparagine synthetase B family protein [Aquirufa ecclesiirivi]MDF0693085.1 asparagine synthase-related protein [Aquirufa ecclesiirivi]